MVTVRSHDSDGRALLGQMIADTDWTPLYRMNTCDEMTESFYSTITRLVDCYPLCVTICFQKAWSTIEKEAYAAIWALQKFRNWIFGQPATVINSDHNPLTYITESSTKSAKLMRWLLSLQSYNVTFKYKEGRKNVVADCLSSLDSATE